MCKNRQVYFSLYYEKTTQQMKDVMGPFKTSSMQQKKVIPEKKKE